MKFRFLVQLVLIVFAIQSALAQNAIQWEACFGGNGNDVITNICEMGNGDIIMVGSTDSADGDWSTINGLSDFAVIRMDSLGNKIWAKTYGGSGYDLALGVVKGNGDKIYVVGETKSHNLTNFHVNTVLPNPRDALVICIDGSGNLLWERCYGSTAKEVFYDVVHFDGSNSIYALGYSDCTDSSGDLANCIDSNNIGQGAWVVQINANTGAIIKCRKYRSGSVNHLYDLKVFNSSEMLAAGDTHYGQNSYGGIDCWYIKIDTALNIIWNQRFGSNYNEELKQVFVTQDSGFIVYGESSVRVPASGNMGFLTSSATDRDMFYAKYNQQGVLQYMLNYGSNWYDESLYGSTIVQTADRGFIFGIRSRKENYFGSFPHPNGNSVIFKVDTFGVQQWVRRYASGTNSIFVNIHHALVGLSPTSDGGLICFANGKLAPNVGCQTPAKFGSSTFFRVFKLNHHLSVENNKIDNIRINVFPNPSTGVYNIVLKNKIELQQLSIYNAQGKLIKEIRLNTNEVNISIDISSYPSGLYFIKFETKTETLYKKILKN